jgi:hypothetical protein
MSLRKKQAEREKLDFFWHENTVKEASYIPHE